MIKVYPTGWYYRKDDKKGNVELKNKYTGEIIKQINGGSWDNYTIIHTKKDGSFFVKQTEQLDACMYIACHRDGDTLYSENWQEEGRKKYEGWTLEELLIGFAKESTPEQTEALLDTVQELSKVNTSISNEEYVKEINSKLEIVKLGTQKFKVGKAGGYCKPNGYALKHPELGYLAINSDSPYNPRGGKKTLKEILSGGGFTDFSECNWIQEMN